MLVTKYTQNRTKSRRAWLPTSALSHLLAHLVNRVAVVCACSSRCDRKHRWYRTLCESRDGGKEQEGRSACERRQSPFVIEHAEREMRFLLTECGLEAVGAVLADAVPAVEVERADATCDIGGNVRGSHVTMDVGKRLPDACDEGWDGTRTSISCHTSDDAQSAHDECGDSRLQARGEICGEVEKGDVH